MATPLPNYLRSRPAAPFIPLDLHVNEPIGRAARAAPSVGRTGQWRPRALSAAGRGRWRGRAERARPRRHRVAVGSGWVVAPTSEPQTSAPGTGSGPRNTRVCHWSVRGKEGTVGPGQLPAGKAGRQHRPGPERVGLSRDREAVGLSGHSWPRSGSSPAPIPADGAALGPRCGCQPWRSHWLWPCRGAVRGTSAVKRIRSPGAAPLPAGHGQLGPSAAAAARAGQLCAGNLMLMTVGSCSSPAD